MPADLDAVMKLTTNNGWKIDFNNLCNELIRQDKALGTLKKYPYAPVIYNETKERTVNVSNENFEEEYAKFEEVKETTSIEEFIRPKRFEMTKDYFSRKDIPEGE